MSPDLRETLAHVARPADIRRIASGVRSADEVRRLFALTADGEERIAYRAAWTLCHLGPAWHALLHERYDDLAAAAIAAPHAGRRRLLLALLWRQLGPECASDFITDLAALGKVGFRIVFFQ